MGADLILARLWMPEGREPDWEAARRAVETVPVETLRIAYAVAYEHVDPDEVDKSETYLRELALQDLRIAESVWNGELRTCYDVSIPGITIMVAGDRTWGDPVEEVNALHFLAQAGILQAAGFFRGNLPALLDAAQDVVNRWECGDLDEAVSRLAAELEPFRGAEEGSGGAGAG